MEAACSNHRECSSAGAALIAAEASVWDVHCAWLRHVRVHGYVRVQGYDRACVLERMIGCVLECEWAPVGAGGFGKLWRGALAGSGGWKTPG